MRKAIPELSLKIMLDILYFLFLPSLILLYVGRRKYHAGWLERLCLGRWKRILKERKPLIWIHAVSLGEARLALMLYRNLKMRFLNFKYLLTTITPLGESYLKGNISPSDYLAYLPLDFSFLMGHLVSRLSLKAVVILETEIWPNLIIQVKRKGLPLGLVNARVSRGAYLRYKIVRPVISSLLNLFDFVCLSGKVAEERFKALGLKEGKGYLTGSLKFDLERADLRRDSRLQALSNYLKKSNSILFIAGSTHPGEDIQVLKAYQKASRKHPKLRLLLAPRHPQKLNLFQSWVENLGYQVEYFSKGFDFNKDRSIFLVDEMGHLASLYQLAEIVYVGGSLVNKGGHNIIEPALFRKPILIGPYYHNFEEIVWEFVNRNAVVICRNEDQLAGWLRRLLEDEKLRLELGERAYQTSLAKRGSIDKTLEIISSYIR